MCLRVVQNMSFDSWPIFKNHKKNTIAAQSHALDVAVEHLIHSKLWS